VAPPPFEKRLLPEELYLEVLDRAVEVLDGAELSYLFVGGIASAALGRPRLSIDIDVIVRPHDALRALEALGDDGFRTQEYDPAWLFKGELDGVVVDLIFVSSGGVYLDEEMLAHARVVEFAGRKLRVAGPEDLILMKSLAHSEPTPRYWFDALGIIGRTEVDWDYLVHRARLGPRRLLSLLFYAQSKDLAVPERAIRELYRLAMSGDVEDGDGVEP
jgi:predicted nucleotidyltransferase